MDPKGFELRQRLSSRVQARAVFDEALASARRRVRLFDSDGSFWGLERLEVAEALDTLLKAAPDNTVTIVLHRFDAVVQRAPRIVQLVRTFSPRMQVFGTDETIRSYARGVMIADDSLVIRRPHLDRTVCWSDYDEGAIAAAANLFDEVLGHTVPGIPSHVTGL